MRVQFNVEGLPPKKNGAITGWGKRVEASKRLRLRTAALGALRKPWPRAAPIRLTLRVHVPEELTGTAVELDEFVGGVCDGLQREHERAVPGSVGFLRTRRASAPLLSPALLQDGQIISTDALEVHDDNNQSWYEVILEGD